MLRLIIIFHLCAVSFRVRACTSTFGRHARKPAAQQASSCLGGCGDPTWNGLLLMAQLNFRCACRVHKPLWSTSDLGLGGYLWRTGTHGLIQALYSMCTH